MESQIFKNGTEVVMEDHNGSFYVTIRDSFGAGFPFKWKFDTYEKAQAFFDDECKKRGG